ncbi:MAG: D-alanine--D-alanine ligase [Candidatus Magnetoovum sp. WYHC-5]|nr:D-alanine--D-alanine ligase [Candidatus Magnetoovum sp. WYHC-5]
MRDELRDKNIAVLMGGLSSEREVSLRSGMAMFDALIADGYDAISIDADEQLCMKLISHDIDIALLALHGGFGEDGSIQGMLEVMGIPYTGSGVLASGICIDKLVSKIIFKNAALTVSPYVVVDRDEYFTKKDVGFVPFNIPWVIKPHKEGSSVGVSTVKRKSEIDNAISEAFAYGQKTIIERFIQGREIHVGILCGKVLGMVEVRPKKGFYDYESKYTSGLTEYILPPPVDDITYNKLAKEALKAYEATDCSGVCRVDFILSDEDGMPYILEINTLPGMTENSLIPKIAMYAGYTFLSLIEEMLMDMLKEKKYSNISV